MNGITLEGCGAAACVTTCQKESRLGMMAAMNLCIKSWSQTVADHLGQSFPLHSECVSVKQASLPFSTARTAKAHPHKHTIHMADTAELLFPAIQNNDGIVLFLC